MLGFEVYENLRKATISSHNVYNGVVTLVGQSADGTKVVHEFNGVSGNLLITGMPGSGLMNSVWTMIYDLSTNSYKFSDYHLTLLDFSKSNELEMFGSYAFQNGMDVEMHYTSKESYMCSITDTMMKEITGIMYNDEVVKPHIYVLNYLSVFKNTVSSNKWKMFSAALSDILNTGYKNNVFVVIVDTDVTDVLNASLMSKFESRLLLRHYDSVIDKFMPVGDYEFKDKFGIGYYSTNGIVKQVDLPSVLHAVKENK